MLLTLEERAGTRLLDGHDFGHKNVDRDFRRTLGLKDSNIEELLQAIRHFRMSDKKFNAKAMIEAIQNGLTNGES
jgi:hypothetical protein